MSDTPNVRATDLLAKLRRRANRLGLEHEEIEAKGSHLKVRHGLGRTIIPMHRGDLPAGTYRAVLRQLGLSQSDLEE